MKPVGDAKLCPLGCTGEVDAIAAERISAAIPRIRSVLQTLALPLTALTRGRRGGGPVA
ncbi:MAG TPA: hypothetical protein VFI30_03540 [Nocardioidaceae bacterium]|nr:hypothetical protein [Nocardioidaceae bacterium]